MNKNFFKGMKTFANIVLVLGIVLFFIMLFTVTFVRAPDSSRYSPRYEAQVSATGFVSTVACLIGSIVLYYFLKGMALMGQRAFNDEAANEDFLAKKIAPFDQVLEEMSLESEQFDELEKNTLKRK